MKLQRLSSLLTIVVLLLCFRPLKAQDYFCISVDPASGMLSVTCHPVDYTQVTQYVINYSEASGANPGSFNGTPTAAEDTYPIPGTNGNTTRYLVDVVFQPAGVSPYGHSISSIRLTVTPASLSVARLDWNPVDPAIPGVFYVERFDAPSWITLATVNYAGGASALSYIDTVTSPHCSFAPVLYRVRFDEQLSSAGCTSVSNEGSGNFEDQIKPDPPAYDTVSVYSGPLAPDYALILGWAGSPSTDVVGYTIYRAVTRNGIFDSIGFVPLGIYQYIDTSAHPCTDNLEYYYAIVSTDGCMNRSTNIIHALSPHNLVLDLNDIDPCERKVFMQWNAYDNMPGGLGGYRILRSINGGSFSTVDSVDSGTTSFTDSLQFINGYDYTYFIQAFSQTGLGSSSSCIKRKRYYGPVVPDTLYIEQASVINNSMVEVKYRYSPVNRVKTLVLERAIDPLGPFQVVDTLASTGNGYVPSEYLMYDPSADVQNQSYYYRLTMIDSCNKAALNSVNLARTILLHCNPFGTNSNKLDWNEYSTWYQGVDRYEIYRTVNGVPDPVGPLTTITAAPLEYIDDLNALLSTASGCYYIKVYENAGNPYFTGAVSVSNEACAIRDPIFLMPTAFNPTGYNTRFRPKTAFVDNQGFKMLIYNRWGQMIFETKDILSGWDGRIKGEISPAGVYMYVVSYQSSQGDKYEKRGLFTLVQ